MLELLSRWERRAWEMLREIQPVQRPTEAPPGIVDIHDPEVRARTRDLLHAINDARKRRLAGQGKR